MYGPIIITAFGAAVSAAVAYHNKRNRRFTWGATIIAVGLFVAAVVLATNSGSDARAVSVQGCGNTVIGSAAGAVNTNNDCK